MTTHAFDPIAPLIDRLDLQDLGRVTGHRRARAQQGDLGSGDSKSS
jgi:hypothetical protein